MFYNIINYKFNSFIAEFVAIDSISLALIPEVSFRGGFGYVFKKLLCNVKHGKCNDCIISTNCAYHIIFESPAKNGETYTQQFSFLPHPIIFNFPDSQKSKIKKGEKFNIEFSLIGISKNYLPYIILCFQQIGLIGLGPKRGKAKLISVAANDMNYMVKQNSKNIIIFTNKNNEISDVEITTAIKIDEEKILNSFNSNLDKTIKIEFVSPLRLKHNNSFSHEMKFHMLVKGVLRRLSTISDIYLEQKFSDDFVKELLNHSRSIITTEKFLSWQEMDRYSTRKKVQMKLGGYVGEITYRGDLQPYEELFALSKIWHIGKASSFGFGKINYKWR